MKQLTSTAVTAVTAKITSSKLTELKRILLEVNVLEN
jgi:hypothetical protein